jgi:type IV pilus assembly protein PilP
MSRPTVFSLGVVCTLVAACGSPPVTSKAIPKPAAKASKATVPEPAVTPPPEEVYSYSAVGKRDPFRSPLDDLIIQSQSDSQCPLCKWEIDQLRLVAVVTGTGNPVAMVEDPDGVGHVVRQGTQVGRRNGKVTTIRRDELVVAELGHDPFGKAISNKTILKIPHNPAEAPQQASLLDE